MLLLSLCAVDLFVRLVTLFGPFETPAAVVGVVVIVLGVVVVAAVAAVAGAGVSLVIVSLEVLAEPSAWFNIWLIKSALDT